MRREATGEVRFIGGIWTTRVRVLGKRESFDLPTSTTKDAAIERSKLIVTWSHRFKLAGANRARAVEALKIIGAASARSLDAATDAATELLDGKIPIPEKPKAPTFEKVGERWTSGELARLYPDQVKPKDYDDDAARLKFFSGLDVGGVKLGDLPIDAVTLDHCEEAMRQLPKCRPSTRRHYAQTLHRVLALAVYPLRHIKANPLPRGFMPSAGKPPAFSYIYPNEDAQLMGCADVTLQDRLLFGFLDREGPRAGEATELPIDAFDLVRGVIRLDENKTDDPRAWVLDPGVVRALRVYLERYRPNAKPGDLMFLDADGEAYSSKLARRLRSALKKAKVDRTELHDGAENRRRLRAHDLRATFTTLSLANGKSETWVADRTGHRSSAMINRYRRAARSAMELGLGTLAPLYLAIPELCPLPQHCPTEEKPGLDDDAQVMETSAIGEMTEWPKVPDSKTAQSPEKTATPENPAAPEQSRTDVSGASGQSRGNESTPRERMIAGLHAELGEALRLGDTEAARVAHEAIGRLLGTAGSPAPVADLAAERRRRER